MVGGNYDLFKVLLQWHDFWLACSCYNGGNAIMTKDLKLKYDEPRNLGVQKMHELVYGIEWFEKKENQDIYESEKDIITGKK